MDNKQFQALALTEQGRQLYSYVTELVTDLVDIRTIETVSEVEILARKRAAELIQAELVDKLSPRPKQENYKPTDWE